MLELVLAIVVLISTIFLGLVVYLKNPRARTNRLLALTIFWAVVWAICNFLENQGFGRQVSAVLLRLDFAAGPMVAYFWLLFCLNFQGSRGGRSSGTTVTKDVLFLLPPAVLVVVSFSDLMVHNIRLAGTVIHYDPGILYVPYGIINFTYMIVLGLGTLFVRYRASSGVQKLQLRYIFLGLFISGGLAAGINIVLTQIVPDLPLAVSRIGVYGILTFTIFATYSIIKHRLMDIRALVLKSVAYSIILGIIAGAYALATQFVMRWFQGAVYQTGFNIAVIFAAIFGFNPLRRFVEKYTDKIFAKGRYNFRELLGRLGNIASEKVNLTDLTHSTLEVLAKDMRIRKAAFVITESPQVTEVDVVGYKSKSKSTWEKVAKLVKNSQIIVADELGEEAEEKEVLRKMQVDVVVPLPTEDKVVGLLALGEKRSGDMYTAEDLKLLEIIAPEEAIAVHKARLFRLNEERISELNSINKLALEIGSTLDLDKLLSETLDEAIRVTGAETGSIMLLDEKNKTLSIRTARGIPKELCHRKMKMGEGIAGWVAQKEQPLCLIDGQHQELKQYLKREEITSSLSVPLKVRDRLIGVLSVNRKKKKELFTDANLRVMASFASQAAEAIENARLYEKSENQFMETIRALTGAVEAKDPYTKGHSDVVTNYAVLIAREMGFSEEELRNVEIAGRLHDIGKIGIPEAILNKPGKLTDEERKVIEEHPKIGAHILKNAPSLKEIMPVMLYHHERYDGRGYPTGLAGETIPLEARIMAVADSFNAMTSDRPYRKALPLEVAIDELKRCSGGQFDPEVVGVFLKILAREKEAFRKEKEKKKTEMAKVRATKAA